MPTMIIYVDPDYIDPPNARSKEFKRQIVGRVEKYYDDEKLHSTGKAAARQSDGSTDH